MVMSALLLSSASMSRLDDPKDLREINFLRASRGYRHTHFQCTSYSLSWRSVSVNSCSRIGTYPLNTPWTFWLVFVSGPTDVVVRLPFGGFRGRPIWKNKCLILRWKTSTSTTFRKHHHDKPGFTHCNNHLSVIKHTSRCQSSGAARGQIVDCREVQKKRSAFLCPTEDKATWK